MIVTRYVNGVKIDGQLPEMEIANTAVVSIIQKLQAQRDEQANLQINGEKLKG